MFDASVAMKLTDTSSVKIGAENLFGTSPEVDTKPSARGLIYSRNAPYDSDGGQYYARLDVRF
jgi:iron complex outermembrane receptor protein